MPTYFTTVFSASQTTPDNDIVYITANGFLKSGLAIGRNSDVYVQGYSLLIGDFTGAGNASADNIVIADSGLVGLVSLHGNSNSVSNAGVIDSAVEFGESGFYYADEANIVTNTGLIQTVSPETSSFIPISSKGIAHTEIYNSGTISNSRGDAIKLDTGNDKIVNSGSIFGAVDVGDGTDLVDNTTGSIAGDIKLGSNADTIRNGGTITGNIDAGDGFDKFVNSGVVRGTVALGAFYDELTSTGSILGDVDFGSGGCQFFNTGTVRGDVVLGADGDFGVLYSSQGTIFGTITGGSAGNTIYTSNVGNIVTGGAGTDTVRGGTGDDDVSAAGGDDALFGGGGDDYLDGGGGADTLIGGSGDDAYIVESSGDFVNEVKQGGSGYDYIRVVGAIDFDLSDKAHVRGDIEDLFMDGATLLEAIDGTGNGLDNMITGNGAFNTLDGRGGDDELFGAHGNDILIGGEGDDKLYGMDANDTLRGGAGADRLDGGAGVADLADYLAGATAGVTVALDGSLAGTGDALGDTFSGIERLRGTNFADTLRGDAKANTILGQNGADTIDGRDGGDRLIGGLGVDTLTGGEGSDRFEYTALGDIGDVITDFIGYNDTPSIDEAIVITGAAFGGGLTAGGLALSQFQSRADNVAQDADDRFVFQTKDRTLWFDVDGNGATAAVMVCDLQAGADLQYTDVIIV